MPFQRAMWKNGTIPYTISSGFSSKMFSSVFEYFSPTSKQSKEKEQKARMGESVPNSAGAYWRHSQGIKNDGRICYHRASGMSSKQKIPQWYLCLD